MGDPIQEQCRQGPATTPGPSTWNQDDVSALLERVRLLHEVNASLIGRLHHHEQGLPVLLKRSVRRVRRVVFPQGTLTGKIWSYASRFTRIVATQGPRAALTKTIQKATTKLGSQVLVRGESPYRPEAASASQFKNLPWRYLGAAPADPGASRRLFKVLLVGHSACRTGAPLVLLRLAEEIRMLPGIECFVVLKQGGVLADSFARVAPTLELESLVELGHNRDTLPMLIASQFRAIATHGVAVCNTIAVSDFHEAFATVGQPVLSWIHELPTAIGIFGGRGSAASIQIASRQVIVPAEVVRRALLDRFGLDAGLVRTLYYGLDLRTSTLDRGAARHRVRREFGIPDDAMIVLGCGTLDLRKGADLFVQVARHCLGGDSVDRPAKKTWFLWVGHFNDESLRRWMVHDLRQWGMEDRVCFLGERDDTTSYFLAADLLLLTSREDPCPFAMLEAMEAGLPVVSFLGNGGAEEVLGETGSCVPYLDVPAMSREVRSLLGDSVRRQEMGRRGAALIRERFTWDRFRAGFRTILETHYHYLADAVPTVSVIVPNYRHARYLKERLQSIFDQTHPPMEILFLDDASPDNSLEVAREMARRSPVPMRIIPNETNSGSTFRQWIKGVELARGDLVWIAESDDCCEPTFLERLVPEFFDPEVMLAYCQSQLIDSAGNRLAEDFLDHTDDISPTRWRSGYRVTAIEELEQALGRKNTIPNASAVLFRRKRFLEFGSELETLRYAGDWLCYALQIRHGKIAFLPEPLNVYRRHEQTVTQQAVRGELHSEETLLVRARLFEEYEVTADAIAQSLGQSAFEYCFLTEKFGLDRPGWATNSGLAASGERIRRVMRDRSEGSRSQPRALVVIHDEGGAAASRAASALIERLSGQLLVYLCSARPLARESRFIDLCGKVVVFIEGTLGQTVWADSQEGATAFSPSSRRCLVLRELARFHEIELLLAQPGLAHRLASAVNEDLGLPLYDTGSWEAMTRRAAG